MALRQTTPIRQLARKQGEGVSATNRSETKNHYFSAFALDLQQIEVRQKLKVQRPMIFLLSTGAQ